MAARNMGNVSESGGNEAGDDDVTFVEIVQKKLSNLHKKAVNFLCDMDELIAAKMGRDLVKREDGSSLMTDLKKSRRKLLQSAVMTARAADFDMVQDVDVDPDVLDNVNILTCSKFSKFSKFTYIFFITVVVFQ